MGLIDSIKSGASSLVSTVKEVEQKVEAKVEEKAVQVLNTAEAFVDTQKKPMSITGKAQAYVPSSVSGDLAGAVNNLRSLANSGLSSKSLTAQMSVPTTSAPSGTDAAALKSAISDQDDSKISEIVNANPAVLKELNPEEKGKALKRLEQGWVSKEDSAAMTKIVQSATSKSELRSILRSATNTSDAQLSQPDISQYTHKFDKQMTDTHPCLIADLLNPANKTLPEKPIDPDNNVPESLQPINQDLTGDHIPFSGDNGGKVHWYKTGDNWTKVPEGALDATVEQQKQTQANQQEQISKMQAAMPGTQISNPPTIQQAQQYFQKIAGKGTPAEVDNVKKELGNYLTNFYVHAGQGVDWGAGKNLANNLEKSLADQPKLKDGRTVIDCEGFAAITERLLAPVKDPAGKPMFEIMQGATPNHAIVGVFRAGDPFKAPFMVSNNSVTTIPQDTVDSGKKLSRPGQQTEVTQKWLLKQLVYDEVNGGHGKPQTERPALETGRSFDSRKPYQ